MCVRREYARCSVCKCVCVSVRVCVPVAGSTQGPRCAERKSRDETSLGSSNASQVSTDNYQHSFAVHNLMNAETRC